MNASHLPTEPVKLENQMEADRWEALDEDLGATPPKQLMCPPWAWLGIGGI